MKILLVNLVAVVSFSVLKEKFKTNRMYEIPLKLNIPLGLLYLSSYAKKYAKRNFEIKILDFNKKIFEFLRFSGNSNNLLSVEKIFENIISKTISNFHPSIIAISISFTSTHYAGAFISNLFRRYCPDAYIVGGGIQATEEYSSLLEYGSFDAIIRGEGEIPFTNLINMYEFRQKEYPIIGMVNKKHHFENCDDNMAVMIEDLDTIPFPDWELLSDIDLYICHSEHSRGTEEQNLRTMPIMTTRGCPMRCSFCASHAVHGRKVRSRSLDNIYDEIENMIAKYKINTLITEDDLFNFTKKRVIDFCKESIKRNWKLRIEFANGLAIWTLDEEVIDWCVKGGVEVINLAIESGSPYVQKKIIRKNLNLQHARHIAEIISRYPEIESRSYYIIGFPGENMEHIQETKKFAESMPQDWCVFMIAMPLPGSELYEECVNLGYIKRDNNFENHSFWSPFERDFDTNEFTKDELMEIYSDLNIHINFLSNRNILNGNYQKAIPIFQKIVEDYPYHVIARYCLWRCFMGLNIHNKAQKELKQIQHWIKHNELSNKLYMKYKNYLNIQIEHEQLKT